MDLQALLSRAYSLLRQSWSAANQVCRRVRTDISQRRLAVGAVRKIRLCDAAWLHSAHREGALLVALPVLATRMQRWDVSCFRIMNLKLSALCPFVPRSRAKGGSHPSGGTMQAIPALQRTEHESAACSRPSAQLEIDLPAESAISWRRLSKMRAR